MLPRNIVLWTKKCDPDVVYCPWSLQKLVQFSCPPSIPLVKQDPCFHEGVPPRRYWIDTLQKVYRLCIYDVDTLQLAYPISSWQHGPCLAGGTDGGQENWPSFCNDHGQYTTSGSRFLVHKMMFLGSIVLEVSGVAHAGTPAHSAPGRRRYAGTPPTARRSPADAAEL